MNWLFRLLLLALILALVIVSWLNGREPRRPQLIIEDSHAAAWTHIDNAFTTPSSGPVPTELRWDGLLIQVGDFHEYNANGRLVPRFGFSGIAFEAGNDIVTLQQGDFSWINIVGDYPGQTLPPISAEDSKLLYPTGRETGCTVVEICPPIDPLPTPASCESQLTDVPQPCLRMRSLNSMLVPRAIITYWQGQSGYTMTARQIGNEAHNRFKFSLNDDVVIEVYGVDYARRVDIEEQIQALGSTPTITVISPGTPGDHGDIHEPPLTFGG